MTTGNKSIIHVIPNLIGNPAGAGKRGRTLAGKKLCPWPILHGLIVRSYAIKIVDKFKEWHTDATLWVKLKPIVREMRHKPTEAENLLWQKLRNCQLSGYKFRRQHNIERFIVDFYCAEANLVVEVDGPVHQYQKNEDEIRQQYIESQGLKLIRFTNDAVLNDMEQVLKQIAKYLVNLSS